jgi:hypothetical protein
MNKELKSASEKKKEDWMQSRWRPAMGWMYMVVCMFDMILFPILWSLLQTFTSTPITQWNPLTLQGAGLFHIAMGAVLGIAAFGRTQEKLGGANNGGLQPVAQSVTTTFGSPQPGFGSQPQSGGFDNFSFNTTPVPGTAFTPAPSWGTTPIATTANGKKIVPEFDQPEI